MVGRGPGGQPSAQDGVTKSAFTTGTITTEANTTINRLSSRTRRMEPPPLSAV
jgi:hypothetical protein